MISSLFKLSRYDEAYIAVRYHESVFVSQLGQIWGRHSFSEALGAKNGVFYSENMDTQEKVYTEPSNWKFCNPKAIFCKP